MSKNFVFKILILCVASLALASDGNLQKAKDKYFSYSAYKEKIHNPKGALTKQKSSYEDLANKLAKLKVTQELLNFYPNELENYFNKIKNYANNSSNFGKGIKALNKEEKTINIYDKSSFESEEFLDYALKIDDDNLKSTLANANIKSTNDYDKLTSFVFEKIAKAIIKDQKQKLNHDISKNLKDLDQKKNELKSLSDELKNAQDEYLYEIKRLAKNEQNAKLQEFKELSVLSLKEQVSNNWYFPWMNSSNIINNFSKAKIKYEVYNEALKILKAKNFDLQDSISEEQRKEIEDELKTKLGLKEGGKLDNLIYHKYRKIKYVQVMLQTKNDSPKDKIFPNPDFTNSNKSYQNKILEIFGDGNAQKFFDDKSSFMDRITVDDKKLGDLFKVNSDNTLSFVGDSYNNFKNLGFKPFKMIDALNKGIKLAKEIKDANLDDDKLPARLQNEATMLIKDLQKLQKKAINLRVKAENRRIDALKTKEVSNEFFNNFDSLSAVFGHDKNYAKSLQLFLEREILIYHENYIKETFVARNLAHTTAMALDAADNFEVGTQNDVLYEFADMVCENPIIMDMFLNLNSDRIKLEADSLDDSANLLTNNSTMQNLDFINQTQISNRLRTLSNPNYISQNIELANAILEASKYKFAGNVEEVIASNLAKYDYTRNIWMNILGGINKEDSKLDTNLVGLMLGVDKTYDNFILGGFASYMDAKTNSDRNLASIKSKIYQLALYTRIFLGQNEIDAITSYMIAKNNIQRLDNEADFNSNYLDFSLAYGYNFDLGNDYFIKPLIKFSYIMSKNDGYDEHGSTLGVSTKDIKSQVLNGALNLEFKKYFKDGSYIYLEPGYERNLKSSGDDFKYKFITGGQHELSIKSNKEKRGYFLINMGSNIKFKKQFSINLDLAARMNKEEKNYNGNLGLNYAY